MGYYINQINGKDLPATRKAKSLIENGAIETDSTFKPNLVCVVQNGFFDAAAYIYNERELIDFTDPNDARLRTFLVVENADVLSGYSE